MNLAFNLSLVKGYKSATQIARILTEDWLSHNTYCPICGAEQIIRAEANVPVKDYTCEKCKAQYELKSKNILLHYSVLDDSGELSIYCDKPYHSLSDALSKQEIIISNWMSDKKNVFSEAIGRYKRIARVENLGEIQVCIEEFDI